MYAFYLSCPSATFALQHGSFVPREWLVAKAYWSYLFASCTTPMESEASAVTVSASSFSRCCACTND